ncbi:MAG: ArsR family transcriptional regulator [Deltaproteobacteria bacterium]|nr:MAG: ArsR family transcriptional regulator [Deltaproteobacteria bacterium]
MDEKVLESLSRLFRLLNDTNRLKILFAIGKETKSVSEIMDETRLPQTLVSFHLRPLREGGILVTERRGAFVLYSLAEPLLIDLLISLCGVSPKGMAKDEIICVCPPMPFLKRWMKGGD